MYGEVMVSITIDTSVVIAVSAEEASKRALVRATRDAALVAPASVHWEVGNAVSAMLRQKRVQLAQAQAIVAAYRAIPLRLIDVEISDALRISDETGLYAYDAYVLACADALGTALLSLDSRMMTAAKDLGIEVMEIGK